VADVTITRLGDDHFRVVTGAGFIDSDLGWIKAHMDERNLVEVRDITDEWVCIGLWGPKARDVLSAVTRDDVSSQAFPYMCARTIDIGGARVLAQRVTYVGELGWELYVEPAWAVQVWDALMAAGKEHGIVAGGYKALDSLRLEKGYKYYSADVTMLENPYEAGLGFCVQLDKGDFIGKAALMKAKQASVQQKLCTLTVGGEEYLTLYGGEAVFAGDRCLGRVRSAGFGYTVKKNIALAYLPLDLAKVGIKLELDIFGRRVPAQVAPTALVDPKGEHMRG
jgi:glycine cleavage system aminomethyltransferase T